MKIHLDELIESLRKNVLQMANMVNESVGYAIQALYDRDEQLARTVIEKDKQVDRMENLLDEEALRIFALQQPLAIDLRFVVMVLKMNNDFERIGDLAVNISERVLDFVGNDYYNLYDELNNFQEMKYMANRANEMSRLAMQCIIDKDTDMAHKVIKMDNVVDSYNKSLILKCIAEISDREERPEFFINLISISKNLERVADHATNIAQDLIYMVEGENIRHPGLEKEK